MVLDCITACQPTTSYAALADSLTTLCSRFCLQVDMADQLNLQAAVPGKNLAEKDLIICTTEETTRMVGA